MSTEIKVLMVGPDRGVHGGISAIVNELYAAGLDHEVELKYIGTMKEGSKLKKLLVAAFAYAHFCRKLKWCDVVHVHFSSDSSFMRKSLFIKRARKAGKKVVLHQHGGDFKTYYGQQLDKKGRDYVAGILAMGDVMLVLTEGWKEFFGQITDPDKIVVFPNGIRVSKYLNEQKNVTKKEDINVSSKDFNEVLFLGRICKDKGIDELIEAMKEIHSSNSNAHLFVGGIYEDNSYRQKIEDNSDFITYLGWVTGEEKDKYLDQCGILVLPSYYEGFPVSIIEAMLRGNAVVASAVGGIPEIIDDGKDGILIPPKDSKALQKGIEKLMNDREYASSIGILGRKKVIEKYSVEENIKRLIQIYSKILG